MSSTAVTPAASASAPAKKSSFLQKFETAMLNVAEFFPEILGEVESVVAAAKSGTKVSAAETAVSAAADVASIVDPGAAPIAETAGLLTNVGISEVTGVVNAIKAAPAPVPTSSGS